MTSANRKVRADKIPAEDLNEWGYPAPPKWAFAGFTKGWSYWRLTE